jgi:arsenate reductase (glutaredoxin)
MAMTLYGITQCDTVKRARAWLETHDFTYAFHDYRKAGVDRATLEAWVAAEGWERILNRAGTTFRKLPEASREGIDAPRAIELMLAQPSMIRRPILETGRERLVGFRPETYAAALETA